MSALAAIASVAIGGTGSSWLWHVPNIRRRRTKQAPTWPGATKDWSPTDQLRQITAGNLTPTETLPSHVVSPEVREPDTDALNADTQRALAERWVALDKHASVLDQIIARLRDDTIRVAIRDAIYTDRARLDRRREISIDDTQALPVLALPAGGTR